MRDNFDICLQTTLKEEGKWSDHPKDPGGATMYGITLKRYQVEHPLATKEDLRRISMNEVRQIYRTGYWDTVRGNELPAGLDLAVFDFGVNSGPGQAVRTLQRILQVQADGVMGPLTIQAIRRWNIPNLIDIYMNKRLDFFKSLGAWGTFGKGWTNRVVRIRTAALALAAGKTPNISSAPNPTPRANPNDVKITARKGAGAKLTTGAGALAAALSELASKLDPFKDLPYVTWIALGVTLAGGAVLIWRLVSNPEE